jgi:hypothetical protein
VQCSVKWTSLATPAFIAVECYVSIFILKDRLPMRLWWYTLGVAATLYTSLCALHLYLLPFSGALLGVGDAMCVCDS